MAHSQVWLGARPRMLRRCRFEMIQLLQGVPHPLPQTHPFISSSALSDLLARFEVRSLLEGQASF